MTQIFFTLQGKYTNFYLFTPSMNFYKDIEDISQKCKKLGCTQKVVQYCTHLYKLYISQENLPVNKEILIPTCILLGCKISNFIVDRKHITNYKMEVVQLEMELCKLLDFDFNIEDIYLRVNYFLKTYNIDKNVAQYIWVFVNDSLFLKKNYHIDHIILACINLTFIVLNIQNDKNNNIVKNIMKELININTKNYGILENDNRNNDIQSTIGNNDTIEKNDFENNNIQSIIKTNNIVENIMNDLINIYEQD